MKATELLSVLEKMDREQGLWLYDLPTFRLLFPDESNNSLRISLKSHTKSGLLTKVVRGLYANEKARCSVGDRLKALVPYLKPNDINYISQETRLFELGLLLQAPQSYLTVMTSGSSALFHTPFGTVRFTHSARPIGYVLAHTQKDPLCGLLTADATLARKDYLRAGRRRDLLYEAQEAFA